MNVVYLASDTFLMRELMGALERFGGARVRVFTVPRSPVPEAAEQACDALRPYLPALVVSLNDAGLDCRGRLARLLMESGSYLANWYYDYPFYEEIFGGRRMEPAAGRIDFVTEKSFVPEMQSRGFNSYYLPLASDLRFFNDEGSVPYERDVAFVGNSSLELMDSVIDEHVEAELEKTTELIGFLRERYFADFGFDIRGYLLTHPDLWVSATALSPDRFIFAVEWLIGFFYRRDFIKGVASRYGERFTCFGDPYWRHYVGRSPVSGDARYYDTLCRYYRSTMVNINVNRIQTRLSANQRVFDCKAAGAFLLTERREENPRIFVTQGRDRELVEYDSIAHCHELIDYFLEHEDEREAVARAGRDKIAKYHTYDHRLAELVQVCRSHWGI